MGERIDSDKPLGSFLPPIIYFSLQSNRPAMNIARLRRRWARTEVAYPYLVPLSSLSGSQRNRGRSSPPHEFTSIMKPVTGICGAVID
ncbi:hypothetical protein CY34DRAFT_802174, partial [Suillus luteus UH-Slu-Lm8-n1]